MLGLSDSKQFAALLLLRGVRIRTSFFNLASVDLTWTRPGLILHVSMRIQIAGVIFFDVVEVVVLLVFFIFFVFFP